VKNFTCTPNGYFDIILQKLNSLGEIKVFTLIARKTWGWNKESDRISMSQFMSGTGLSKGAVRTALKNLSAQGYILCTQEGQFNWYKICTPLDTEEGQILTGSKNVPVQKMTPLENEEPRELPIRDEQVQKMTGSNFDPTIIQKQKTYTKNNNKHDAAFCENREQEKPEIESLPPERIRAMIADSLSQNNNPLPTKDTAKPIDDPPVPGHPPEAGAWSNDQLVLLDGLTRNGVETFQARKLVRDYPGEVIRNQVAWIDHRKTENRAGYLVKAIRCNYDPPRVIKSQEQHREAIESRLEQEDALATLREQAKKHTHVITPGGQYLEISSLGPVSVQLVSGTGSISTYGLAALEKCTFV
jgi:hypothetical protein